jgi:hypothetical protein
MASASRHSYCADRDHQGGRKTVALHYFGKPVCVGEKNVGEKPLTAKNAKKGREDRKEGRSQRRSKIANEEGRLRAQVQGIASRPSRLLRELRG